MALYINNSLELGTKEFFLSLLAYYLQFLFKKNRFFMSYQDLECLLEMKKA